MKNRNTTATIISSMTCKYGLFRVVATRDFAHTRYAMHISPKFSHHRYGEECRQVLREEYTRMCEAMNQTRVNALSRVVSLWYS
jgi:hypothetical protein